MFLIVLLLLRGFEVLSFVILNIEYYWFIVMENFLRVLFWFVIIVRKFFGFRGKRDIFKYGKGERIVLI